MPALERTRINVRVEDDHVYMQTHAPVYWVWIGRRPHIEALDEEQVWMLIRYRVSFERQCNQRVH